MILFCFLVLKIHVKKNDYGNDEEGILLGKVKQVSIILKVVSGM